MLQFPILSRISAAKALQHEYFKEYEQYPPTFDDRPATVPPTSSDSNRSHHHQHNHHHHHSYHNRLQSSQTTEADAAVLLHCSDSSDDTCSDSPSNDRNRKLHSNETAASSGVSSLESSSPGFDSLNGDSLPQQHSNGSSVGTSITVSTTASTNDNTSPRRLTITSELMSRQLTPRLFHHHSHHLESPTGLLSLAAHETMPPSCSPYSPFQSRHPLTTSSATMDDREK